MGGLFCEVELAFFRAAFFTEVGTGGGGFSVAVVGDLAGGAGGLPVAGRGGGGGVESVGVGTDAEAGFAPGGAVGSVGLGDVRAFFREG